MSEKTHEAVKDPETGQVKLVPVASQDTATQSAEAWFADEKTGHHYTLELDGQTFYGLDLDAAKVKHYGKESKRLANLLTDLARQTEALEAQAEKLTKEKYDLNPDVPDYDEKRAALDAKFDELTTKSEAILQQSDAFTEAQVALYEWALVPSDGEQTITGWSLPRDCTPDNLKGLSVSRKRRLSELVCQQSTLGTNETKNSKRRSRR